MESTNTPITPKQAKEWLRRGLKLMHEIDLLRASRAKMELIASGAVSGTRPARKKAGGRGDSALAAMSDYGADQNERIRELEATLSEISRAIYSVRDGILRLVLINRYVLDKSCEEIAVDMNYRYQHIHRLHGKALYEVAEWMSKHKKDVIECDTLDML